MRTWSKFQKIIKYRNKLQKRKQYPLHVTFRQGIPLETKICRNAFKWFINYSVQWKIWKYGGFTLMLQHKNNMRERERKWSVSTNPRWYPNKNEDIVATSTWGKESLHEGFEGSGSAIFCKRAETHTRSKIFIELHIF